MESDHLPFDLFSMLATFSVLEVKYFGEREYFCVRYAKHFALNSATVVQVRKETIAIKQVKS